MAVYTQVPAEALADLLARFDVGSLVSAKGIAEGVENSNYLVDTSRGRFILTLYEKRVDVADLPFFLALTDHLADRGVPVPRTVRARDGSQVQQVAGRPACLIEFLPGVSPTEPASAQAHAAGRALGRLHAAAADFAGTRANALGPAGWRPLAGRCGDGFGQIAPGLGKRVADELDWLDRCWPRDLPQAVIHADLFPDNVLLIGDEVGGLIDFYFAAREVRAWDVAVMHAAWCFSPDGRLYRPDIGRALVSGYGETFGLSPEEREGFAALVRGVCLRFLLTRAWDWLNTPADALVTRKDPLAFLSRLDFYAGADAAELLT